MRRIAPARFAALPVVVLLALGACGKKETPPPAPEPTRAPPATVAPEADTAEAPAPEADTAEAAAPEADTAAPAPAPAPDAETPAAAAADAESAAAVAKGDGTCVPSEAATPYAATAWVAPATPEPGCLAMTRDGKMAAFLLARDDFMPGDDGEAPAGKSRRVDWYGPEGDEPEEGGPVDLSCLAKGCDDAQREALAAAAAKADLVACRDALAGGVVASDRRAALTVTKDGEPAAEEVVLKRGNGEANVLISLTMTDGDGGDHQILKGAYQLPGGSLFVLWDNGDTGFIDMGVTAVGAAKLGLCAP